MATRSRSPQKDPAEELARAAANLILGRGVSMFGKLIVVAVLTVASYSFPPTRALAPWILLLGVIVAFVIEGVRIVPQQHAFVVERLG
jgi:hypothetical protein